MKDFKPHKTLLAQQSDDEASLVDARVYSVPPVWVTLVDDLNRDLAAIETRGGRSSPADPALTHAPSGLYARSGHPHARTYPAAPYSF